jgi:origin recognition complex subunit 5
VICSLLRWLQRPTAFVDCIEHQLPRQIFETILKQLIIYQSSSSSSSTTIPSCSNLKDFIYILKRLKFEDGGIVLVFDKAERLREISNSTLLLPALLQLDELLRLPFSSSSPSPPANTIIFISELSWDKFLNEDTSGMRSPTPLFFPHYARDQTLSILLQECPSNLPLSTSSSPTPSSSTEETKEFYSSFCSLVYDTLRIVTTDLRELRHATAYLYPHYIKPILEGKATPQETIKLVKNINPFLKKMISKLYMHEVSPTVEPPFASSSPTSASSSSASASASASASSSTSASELPLPLRSKYLLLAAFLASNNPQSLDTRYFSSNVYTGRRTKGGKMKGGRGVSAAASDISRLAIARKPKDFSLERLLAIFRSITEDEPEVGMGMGSGAGTVSESGPGSQGTGWRERGAGGGRRRTKQNTSSLFVQLSSLAKLNLITRVSTEDNLTAPKYRCNISLEFATQVAQTIRFQIINYLHFHEDH